MDMDPDDFFSFGSLTCFDFLLNYNNLLKYYNIINTKNIKTRVRVTCEKGHVLIKVRPYEHVADFHI